MACLQTIPCLIGHCLAGREKYFQQSEGSKVSVHIALVSKCALNYNHVGTAMYAKPSSVFYLTVPRCTACLVDPFCYLCITFVLSVPYLLGKGCPLGSLVCDVSVCFVTFLYGVSIKV